MELTRVLDAIVQDLATDSPQTISIFFNGTEVYRYQAPDGRVFWWGLPESAKHYHPNQPL